MNSLSPTIICLPLTQFLLSIIFIVNLFTGYYFEKVHPERAQYVAYCCGAHRKQSEKERMADEAG